ncbi:CBS domain-containing protein [Streptomyces sp. NBC_01478]|uniref:CBS domain-containing protein n=1 Tax=Streptomyces sp. NBC_01478 TaxID=2903882 RepID=UPI002E34280B|nr:CBS domain-containing protein [Streptomyces sp. NBC_01478]
MKTHTVGEVMTGDVVRAHPVTPFREVVHLLERHRISGVPVVDHDDKVVGVISGTDLVREQARRARAEEGRIATAEHLMSTPAVTVHPELPVPDAARVMERRGIERLPVVDEEDRLIGIATRRDLLRVFLRTDGDIRREVIDDVLVGALGLAPETVTVLVRDGLVTLTGPVERRSDVPKAIRAVWRLEGVSGMVNGLAYRVDDGPPSVRQAPGQRADQTRSRAERP